MTRVDWGQVATTRELLLFGGVVLAVGLLALRLFFAPLSKEIGLLRERANSLRLEKEALVKFSALSPTVTPAGPLARQKGIKIKVLTGEIPGATPEVTSLLAQLTDPGFLGRVTVKGLSYQPRVAEKGFRKTDFVLDLLGGFMDLLGYLERLEEFPALLSLENVVLKVAEGEPQDLEAEIQGRFFQIDSGFEGSAVSQGGNVP